jgi:outer membrane protein
MRGPTLATRLSPGSRCRLARFHISRYSSDRYAAVHAPATSRDHYAQRLTGDAANGPIVTQRGTRNQITYGVGLGYTWR